MAKLGSSWGAEDELLHPRGKDGRFRTKAGVGMLTAVAKRIAQLLSRIDYREFGSDQQASQHLFNDYKDWPEADKRRLLADLHDTQVQLNAGRMDPSTQKFVDMMDAQLQPAHDDLILHRTMGPEMFGIDPTMMDAEDGGVWDLPGKVISSKGYTPTRIGTNKEQGPGVGPIHMAIVAPKGTKIAPTRNGPNDRGVMMDRDLPIRVTKVDRDGRGGYHVTAIVDTEGGGEQPHPLAGTERATGATPEMREGRATAPAPLSPAQRALGEQEGLQREQARLEANTPEARARREQESIEEHRRRLRGLGATEAEITGPTDTGPGGPPPRNEPIHSESIGGAPSPEAPTPEAVPEEPVRTVDFRAAFDEAKIGAPSDGPRRRQFNKAYEGVTEGKRRPDDALRELEADIAVNKRALVQAKADGVSDKDREFEQDIKIQEQLADLIAEQHGLERGVREPERPKPTLSKQDVGEQEIIQRAQRVREGEPSAKPILEKAAQLQRQKEIQTGRRHMTVTQARHRTALEAISKDPIRGDDGKVYREIASKVEGGDWTVTRARFEAKQESKRLRNEAGIARQRADNASGDRARGFRREADENDALADRYDRLREELLVSQSVTATDKYVNPKESKPVKVAPVKKAAPAKRAPAKKAAPKPPRDTTDIDQMTKVELLADPRAADAKPSWTKDRIKAHIRGETPAPVKRAPAKKAAPKAPTTPRLTAQERLAKANDDVNAASQGPPGPDRISNIIRAMDGLNERQVRSLGRENGIKFPVGMRGVDPAKEHVARSLDAFGGGGAFRRAPSEEGFVPERTTIPVRGGGAVDTQTGEFIPPIVETPAAQKLIEVPDRRESFLDAWMRRDIEVPSTGPGESITEVISDISDGRITPDEGIRRLETEIDLNSTDLIDIDRQLRGDLTPEERERLTKERTLLGRAIRADADASKFLRDHFKKEPDVTPDEVKEASPDLRTLGEKMRDMPPSEVADLKRQIKDQVGVDAEGDTGEEVFDDALKKIIKRELAEREAKKSAKLAPPPKAPDKPKPNLEGSKYQRLDARAIAEGLDLRQDYDVRMLDRIQAMLDGEDDSIGKNPTPAAIGRYLDKWRTGPGGPATGAAYRMGVADHRHVGETDEEMQERLRKINEEIAPDLKADQEWKKLADRLMNTRRQRAQDRTPDVEPKVTREERKELADVSELTGIPAEQLEAKTLAKKKAEAPPKQSAVQVAETLKTVGSRQEGRDLLQGRTKAELLEILKATGFTGGPRRGTRATKPEIIDDIVEGNVGARLDSRAIREAFRGESSGEPRFLIPKAGMLTRQDLMDSDLEALKRIEDDMGIKRHSLNREDRVNAIIVKAGGPEPEPEPPTPEPEPEPPTPGGGGGRPNLTVIPGGGESGLPRRTPSAPERIERDGPKLPPNRDGLSQLDDRDLRDLAGEYEIPIGDRPFPLTPEDRSFFLSELRSRNAISPAVQQRLDRLRNLEVVEGGGEGGGERGRLTPLPGSRTETPEPPPVPALTPEEITRRARRSRFDVLEGGREGGEGTKTIPLTDRQADIFHIHEGGSDYLSRAQDKGFTFKGGKAVIPPEAMEDVRGFVSMRKEIAQDNLAEDFPGTTPEQKQEWRTEVALADKFLKELGPEGSGPSAPQRERARRLQVLQGGGEGGEGGEGTGPGPRAAGPAIDENVPLKGDPEGDNSIMHGDSATMELAQAYAKKNRNGTANRLMELRRQISTQRGEDSKDIQGPQKMVDELKQLRDAETDEQLKAKLDDAIKELDFPKKDIPELPEGTPPALRELLENLNEIPVARAIKGSHLHGFTQKDDSPVERIAQLIQRVHAEKGQVSMGEVEREIEDILRTYHESIDGAYRMWGLWSRVDENREFSRQLREWIQKLRQGG